MGMIVIPFSLGGSAALLGGKALPFRQMLTLFPARLRLASRGTASKEIREREPESHRLSTQPSGRAANSQPEISRAHSIIFQRQSRLFLLALILFLAQSALASASWTKQRSGSFAWLHAVYFLDENRGWAVGGKGVLLATDDGGETWRNVPRPTEDALQDVYFSDEQNGWLVCERSIYDLKTNDEPRTYLMRTTDGGKVWKRVNVIGKDVDARLMRALFTTEGRGWAFGEGGLLYTTRDGGLNWERQLVPTRHLLLGGWFLNATQGWLVGAGATILQTMDGGENWRTTVLLNEAGSRNVADAQHVRFNAVSFADRL